MSKENKFEETTIIIPFNSTYNILINKINYLYEHKHSDYLKIKPYMYCPECQTAKLIYCHGTIKKPYLQSQDIKEHSKNCSFLLEYIEQAKLKKIYESNEDKSLNAIQNRLTHLIDFICLGNNTTANPLIIEEKQNTEKNNNSEHKTRKVKQNSIPRKMITNGISDKDLNVFKFFYGKVYIECQKFNKNDEIECAFLRLYNYDKGKKGFLICSIKLNKNVLMHTPTNYLESSKIAYVSFFSEIVRDKNNERFLNVALRHSQFLKIVDIPE